jgi:hypothetical protein
MQYGLRLGEDADLTEKELKGNSSIHVESKGVWPLPQKQVSPAFISTFPTKVGNVQSIPPALPGQLDYSSMGLMSTDSKVVDFCNSSWAIAAAYLYEYKLLTLSFSQCIS